jgi:hypothetical protein
MPVDPNLFVSLASRYTGGIKAPDGPEQAGFIAIVDSAGTNLDYRAPAHASTHAPGQDDAIATGTTSSTVCIGNDARITGALQTSGGTMSGTLNCNAHELKQFCSYAQADITLSSDGATDLYDLEIGGTPNHTYNVRAGFRVTLHRASDSSKSGDIDVVVTYNVTFDGAGVGVVVRMGSFYPDMSSVDASLASCVLSDVALEGGVVRLLLSRPTGVSIKARVKAWINFVEDVT